ncbi:MAG: hypothetical protein AB7R89_16135 [Dehalococcoidia bacterium]
MATRIKPSERAAAAAWLRAEYLQRVRAFLANEADQQSILHWLAGYLQAIADTEDEDLENMTANAWLLFSEFDIGNLDDAGLRAEFQALLEEAEATS